MFDSIKTVLQFMDEWGADKVFLVWFFLLYLVSRRKMDKLQEARLDDAKKSIAALIEAKHVLDAVEENQEHITENQESMMRKLDRVSDKLEIQCD